MKIVSLSSAVAYGHVGNRAAVFPLQRLGVEVWPVDTVQFSNHPGYGAFTGQVLPAAQVAALVAGLDGVGALDDCDGLLTGYLGEAGSGEAALAALARIRASRPDALYLCDPVMGDVGPGLYVRAGIPEFFAGRALAAADVVTPNRFELELLSGRPAGSLAEAEAAARSLLARGPKLVVVTSLEAPILENASLENAEAICCLAVEAGGAWVVRTPRLDFPHPVNGAGDALAGLLLGRLLRGHPGPEALALAVSSLWGVLERTRHLKARELALVAAQEELVSPTRMWGAEPLF